MYSLFLRFHDTGVLVDSEVKEISELLGEHLALHKTSGNSLPRNVHIKVEKTSKQIMVPPGYKKIAFYNNVIIYRSSRANSYFVTDGYSSGFCSPSSGTARILACPIAASDPSAFSPLLFTVLLIELLRYNGLFYLHSGCVARDKFIDKKAKQKAGKHCILIVGEGDSGKTTLTTCFIKSGYNYLSDDAVFLYRRRSGDIIAYGYAREFQFMRDAVNYFPEIKKIAPASYHGLKLPVPIHRLFKAKRIRFAKPDVVLFTKITKKTRTVLTPATNTYAIGQLILNSQQVMFDRALAGKHLGILTAILHQCSCFSASLGRDILKDPMQIEERLEEALCQYLK